MGIFSRIGEIINANINSMLDKAEDPRKMVKLMINEMEDTLIEIKSSAAEVIAERIRLERTLKQQSEKSADWERKASLAVSKSRDDLAREALEQKLAYDRQAETTSEQLKEVEALVSQYQADIKRLDEKLAGAQIRRRKLEAEHKSVENRQKVESRLYGNRADGNAFVRFEEFEARIDRIEAENEINASTNAPLEQKFEDLERAGEVESELARLKSKQKAQK